MQACSEQNQFTTVEVYICNKSFDMHLISVESIAVNNVKHVLIRTSSTPQTISPESNTECKWPAFCWTSSRGGRHDAI